MVCQNEPTTNLQESARFGGHTGVPERTRSLALTEVTLVNRVARAAAHRSLSFSEYSDYYEHQRAGTRISGSVSNATPTVLDWEIGS